MSAATSRPTFGAGLGAALALSAAGAAVLTALTPWLGAASALRTTVALTAFAYALYTLATSRERVGRLTALAGWVAISGGAWLLGPPLSVYVLLHVGLIWLLRSLYRYSGLLPALADLGVGLLGIAFAVWAEQRSGSAWLALWCFFLVQAFYVFIPESLAKRSGEPLAVADDSFARAHRAAEAAVRRLSSVNR